MRPCTGDATSGASVRTTSRPDVLERILGAAHAAPSVGHSQPWRFVIVRDAATRDQAALMADREWHRQAQHLEDRSARQMLDLQLHGIRDAPLGVVVCCDRRAAAEGVLGRATYVDADLWSCAAAIENLWLAARAEGVGVGWVTLFRPEELAALVGAPAGVETLGWLCIGWPDERPPEPGLQRAGWSSRLALSDVVLLERWDDEATPPPASRLQAPAPAAVVEARDQSDVLLTSPGSLGVLDRAVDRLLALGLTGESPVSAVLVAASHPVTRHDVSTYGDSVTREVLAATVAGESLGAVAARLVGAELHAVEAGVDGAPVPGTRSCRPTRAARRSRRRRRLDAGRRVGLGRGRPRAGAGLRAAARRPRRGGHREHDGRRRARGRPPVAVADRRRRLGRRWRRGDSRPQARRGRGCAGPVDGARTPTWRIPWWPWPRSAGPKSPT